MLNDFPPGVIVIQEVDGFSLPFQDIFVDPEYQYCANLSWFSFHGLHSPTFSGLNKKIHSYVKANFMYKICSSKLPLGLKYKQYLQRID